MSQHAQMTYEGYILEGHRQFPQMKVVRCDGSGTIPKELEGKFTSFQEAINAIDFYLTTDKAAKNAARTAKRKADAQADTASGDQSVRTGNDNGDVSS